MENLIRPNRRPATTIAAPLTTRMLLTMAPVQAALASGPKPLRMAMSPKISSGRLPNPAFIMPPQVGPIRPARWSVAVPIQAEDGEPKKEQFVLPRRNLLDRECQRNEESQPADLLSNKLPHLRTARNGSSCNIGNYIDDETNDYRNKQKRQNRVQQRNTTYPRRGD